MTDQRRLLIGVTAGLAILLAGYQGYERLIREPIARRTEELRKAGELAKAAERQLKEARREAGELEDLAKLCLPGEPVKARERYQSYLVELLRNADISTPTVTPANPRKQKNGVIVVPFSVAADTDIYALTKFLHAFYLEPRLQQITNLSLTPLESKDIGPSLRVSLNIEAIALGEGDAPPRGHEVAYTPPVAAGRDAYGSLVEKNILYSVGPGSSALRANDPNHVRLTSILDVGGGEVVEADLYDQAQNVTRRVRVGDECVIGRTRGTILDIGPDMVMLIDGNLYLWKLGQFFSGRTPISAEDALAREVLKTHRRQKMQE